MSRASQLRTDPPRPVPTAGPQTAGELTTPITAVHPAIAESTAAVTAAADAIQPPPAVRPRRSHRADERRPAQTVACSVWGLFCVLVAFGAGCLAMAGHTVTAILAGGVAVGFCLVERGHHGDPRGRRRR